MKKLLLILFIISSFNSKGTIHQIGVWGGYYQFVPGSITIQLGDTIEWEPFAGLLPMMLHTITSDNIPAGAVSFDQVWQMPADTFFQYIPQVAGLYEYVCTPHVPNGMIGEFTVTNVGNTQTYVPDANFEAYLEANGMGNNVLNDDYVFTSAIDTLGALNVSNQNISDLTGIEDFSVLYDLRCAGNNLTSLYLSNNTALLDLNCDNNNLTSLDISNNTLLYDLDCDYNNITSLLLSNNLALISLDCKGNLLVEIDLSNNILLESLDLAGNQIESLDLTFNTSLVKIECDSNNFSYLDLRNGNNTNIYKLTIQNNLQLYCINVDDAAYSNSNWTTVNTNFVLDPQHYFSNNCPMGNLNCSDSLLITDVIIDNTNLTMNIAIYNGYNDFLNYPHVAFTIDANGDTIQIGNMNLFGAFNYDTTWYNYSVSSPSLFPTYPLTSYFVYTSSLTFMSDTCVLTYNSTPTTILYPSYNNEKEIIKITDLIGRESKQTNQILFYIYDDGTLEKKIIIE